MLKAFDNKTVKKPITQSLFSGKKGIGHNSDENVISVFSGRFSVVKTRKTTMFIRKGEAEQKPSKYIQIGMTVHIIKEHELKMKILSVKT